MGLFGSITKALFGGSSSKNESESGNIFADDIKGAFLPSAQSFNTGMGQVGNILGLNGPDASSEALDGWWDSSGGNFLLNQGMDDVDAFYRSKGLGTSGATIKGIEGLRTDLASTKLNEYLGNVFNMNQQALGAGALVSGAGGYSKGQGGGSSSSGGLGTALAAGLALFSDRRLKTDIEEIAREPDGLGIYRYRYIWEDSPRIGVMADEVAQLRPWALGPEISDFATVNYGAL